MEPIFHICGRADWERQRSGRSYSAPSLDDEGFIHLSRADQVVATANRHYRDVDDLVLLAVDPDRVTAEIRHEAPAGATVPRAGETFPHSYGPIPVTAVVAVFELGRDVSGDYTLPAGVGG